MENGFNILAQKLKNDFAVDISIYEQTFLQKSILSRCSVVGVPTLEDYAAYLDLDRDEPRNLHDSMNITYSEFFRNSLTFAHLDQWILPRLIAEKTKNQEIRVWTAGCATGQEPYSIAMIFEQLKTRDGMNPRYRIIATDNSEDALVIARKGEYSVSEVQNIQGFQLASFFKKKDDAYFISDSIKDHVSFSKYDLRDENTSSPQESIFGGFDIVMCCNVLFYYSLQEQRSILQKLVRSVTDQGYFITDKAEKTIVSNLTGLQRLMPFSPIFQKLRK